MSLQVPLRCLGPCFKLQSERLDPLQRVHLLQRIEPLRSQMREAQPSQMVIFQDVENILGNYIFMIVLVYCWIFGFIFRWVVLFLCLLILLLAFRSNRSVFKSKHSEKVITFQKSLNILKKPIHFKKNKHSQKL